MPKKTQACLFLIVIAFAFPITGTQLPYEVLDSIIELTDTDDDYRDLNRVNLSMSLTSLVQSIVWTLIQIT